MQEGQLINSPAQSRGFGIRHIQILLQFLFYVIVFGIETSFSATLQALLDDKKFDLPIQNISQLSYAYLLGFVITELFGSIICKRYGFKWPMVILMGIISAVTLNLPLLSNTYGTSGLFGCRVIQGACIGLLFSMPAEVISRWVPIRERTLLGTTVYASGLLGRALSAYAGSYLSTTMHNWSFLYTQLGYISMIWVVLMAIFGADSPEQYASKMTEDELEYIVQNRGNVVISKKMQIPWRKIFTSMPFWAIVVGQIGAEWILVVSTSIVPSLMVFYFDVNREGNLHNMVALVYLITWVLSFSIAAVAQSLINDGKTTIGQSRKLFNTLGSCIPAFFLMLLTIVTHGNQYVGMAIWVIISVTSIGTICGSKLNSNDITTNFAPVVYGLATWFSMMANILNLMAVGFLSSYTQNSFLIYSGILAVITSLFYLKFASGEEQVWNEYEDMDEEIGLSKSTSRASVDEGKYLLFIKKH